jgi:hypothetical protein
VRQKGHVKKNQAYKIFNLTNIFSGAKNLNMNQVVKEIFFMSLNGWWWLISP